MKWISAKNLEQWSDTLDSRKLLSDLVGSLIRATARTITQYRFPSGDFSQLPGFDGLLEAENIPPWVPKGISVWEFGTGEDPEEKASGDYDKRTKDPKTVDPKNTTFVAVTSRA